MLPVSFSGWMRVFLRRVGAHYGMEDPLHRWQPRVTERAFEELLARWFRAHPDTRYMDVMGYLDNPSGAFRIRSESETEGAVWHPDRSTAEIPSC